MRFRTMERRIILFHVFGALVQSIHGQSPSLYIDNISTDEGSSFTLNCSVDITDVIIFKLDNVAQGSCGAPFLGSPGSCTPAIITQSLADKVTSWTISPALVAHHGSWKCTLGTTDSNVMELIILKLPVAVLTQNGISSDITVNDTSSYPISIEVGCLFSENGPTVELEFVAAGATNASASMSCSNSSTACSGCTGCSAYICSHDISVNQALSGSITIGTPYTLQIKVGVTGTTQTFSSAVFSPHSITFEGTSLEVITIVENIISTKNPTTYTSQSKETDITKSRTTENGATSTLDPFTSELTTPIDIGSVLAVSTISVIAISVVLIIFLIVLLVTTFIQHFRRSSTMKTKIGKSKQKPRNSKGTSDESSKSCTKHYINSYVMYGRTDAPLNAEIENKGQAIPNQNRADIKRYYIEQGFKFYTGK